MGGCWLGVVWYGLVIAIVTLSVRRAAVAGDWTELALPLAVLIASMALMLIHDRDPSAHPPR